MLLRKINTVLIAVAAVIVATFAVTARAPAEQAAGDVTFVPGKILGLTPPEGFTLSDKFTGFVNAASGSSFLVVELPAEAYAQIAPGLTPEALATKGITVESNEPAKFAGVDGILIKGTQVAQGKQVKKWILVLQAPSATIMVTAQDLTGEALDDAAVTAAFASIRFRDAPGLDEQLQQLSFSLGDLGGFRVVRTFAGAGVLLTRGPKDVVKDSSQPAVIILRPMSQPFPTSIFPADLSERLLRAVKTIQITNIEATVDAKVAGGDGYETLASAIGKGANDQVVVAQWLRLDSGKQMQVLAILADQGHEADLAAVRKLVTQLQIK